jgi:hypothetical protein
MADAFADDQIEELLNRIADGEPLRSVCKDPRMPSKTTVYTWLEDESSEFTGRFRARKMIGIHTLVDECLEIADEDASEAVDVANKRVRIDTRLRLAGKWAPKIYGDKPAGDIDNPIHVVNTIRREVIDPNAQ